MRLNDLKLFLNDKYCIDIKYLILFIGIIGTIYIYNI